MRIVHPHHNFKMSFFRVQPVPGTNCFYPQYVQEIKFTQLGRNVYQCHGEDCKYLLNNTINCTNLHFGTTNLDLKWSCDMQFTNTNVFSSDIKVECETCLGVDHQKINPERCNLEFQMFQKHMSISKDDRLFLWSLMIWTTYMLFNSLAGTVAFNKQLVFTFLFQFIGFIYWYYMDEYISLIYYQFVISCVGLLITSIYQYYF